MQGSHFCQLGEPGPIFNFPVGRKLVALMSKTKSVPPAVPATGSLRFAVLIRVSTEKQEKQGESLRTQATQTAQAVASLGGTIVKQYAGQEHATAGYEREQLDSLLADAARTRKPFDAVMVADASRWSRDNAKSKAGLQIFRENGIRFFALTQEYNLFDPNAILFLGMSAEIGEFHARQQRLKSALNCIERARRIGAPTSGRKPFGRTWDKVTGEWGLDARKHAMIQDVAKRYLQGESLPALAREYGINHSFLNKTLAESCGDSYTITWDIKDLNLSESVRIKIPRLLPERTIQAVRKKAIANRTYEHGQPKHPYLLQGHVFCAACGYLMTGQPNHQQLLYYRHRTRARHCHCTLDPLPYVRAEQLEAAVMELLFDTFGNPAAVKKAIEAAIPNRKELKEAAERYERLQHRMEEVTAGRDRVMTFVRKGTIAMDDAEKQLNELNATESAVNSELLAVADILGHQPDAKQVENVANSIGERLRPRVSAKRRRVTRAANADIGSMTWADKRALVEDIFNGEAIDGRPLGVYVSPIDGQAERRRKKWRFVLHGVPGLGTTKCVTQCDLG